MASSETANLPPGVLKLIITETTNTQTSRYNELALDFLYVYDYLVTFDQEVDLVWMKPMSFMKILFLLGSAIHVILNFVILIMGTSTESLSRPLCKLSQRFGLLAARCWSVKFCGHWFKFQSGEALVGLGIIQAILVMRLWAIYKRNGKLLWLLGIFGALQISASATVMGISVTNGIPSSQPAPGFVVCTVTTPPYFAAYWIPILAFEITLFTLTVIKGWKNLRKAHVKALSGASGRTLIKILVRDSIVYFFIISAVYTGNAAVWYWADSSLYIASSVWGIVLPPIVASKLLFSLRGSFYHNETTVSGDHELTTFRAAPSSSTLRQRSTISSGNHWGEWGSDSTSVDAESE